MERGIIVYLDVKKAIYKRGLLPVVVINKEEDAIPAAKAFLKGELPIMEITLRTEAGLPAIKKVAENFSDVLVGAGTVIGIK
ncbi:MAG: 2-dehydro-3-deoxyphosphogluconate aldolase, partial [Clostridiales Family XIII bacterium]|nr:2-dehydro-3-deoxyphosphogluconate aldolase [Clostridiales Family XIII bacterium]